VIEIFQTSRRHEVHCRRDRERKVLVVMHHRTTEVMDGQCAERVIYVRFRQIRVEPRQCARTCIAPIGPHLLALSDAW
jgi:hypothetical protein